ncbi:beta-lactamase-like protein [Panaeolus papilionaceus]|nr:beta-lactamase-like protein [Panaeolus papilionaceus]
MPPGTPYNGFIRPYRIRVDEFTTLDQNQHQPYLHLLTHTHSDHLVGLSAKSFGHRVFCSQDAKSMLLNHEVYGEREYFAQELRAENIRTYSHLFVKPLVNSEGTAFVQGSRDLLRTIPLNTPTTIELAANESVTITLIDANHCPGAVMFLIEGPHRAVLHTGDFRAEPWFLDSLRRNPFLQPYLAPSNGMRINKHSSNHVSKTLEAIYLDTACALKASEVPTKEEAVDGLVQLMETFPESTYFFINSWTWGYEDILKGVARHFQQPIHVDRYKYGIYQKNSDPFLKAITTQEECSTRFHACERFDRCKQVAVNDDPFFINDTSLTGKTVVYVNAVSMNSETWREYLKETNEEIANGVKIRSLLVPLHRHSPLPELQRFVDLFKPKSVVPNTLDPRLQGLDWACIDRLFAPHLHPSSQDQVSSLQSLQERLGIDPRDVRQLLLNAEDDRDVTLKNLVGDGADSTAKRWADQGKLIDTIKFIRQSLGEEENAFIDRLQGINRKRPTLLARHLISARENKPETSRYRGHVPDSDDDTDIDEDEDERTRTAHIIFGVAPKKNLWPSSSPLQVMEEAEVEEAAALKQKAQGTPVGDGSPRMNMLTPNSSPVNKPRVTKLPQYATTSTPSPSKRRRDYSSSRNPVAPKSSTSKGKAKEVPFPEPLSSPFQLITHSEFKASVKSSNEKSDRALKKAGTRRAVVVHPTVGLSTEEVEIIDLVSEEESQTWKQDLDIGSSSRYYKRKRSDSLHVESSHKRMRVAESPQEVRPISTHGQPIAKPLHHFPSTSSVSLSSASLPSILTPSSSMNSIAVDCRDPISSRAISRSSSKDVILTDEAEKLRHRMALADQMAQMAKNGVSQNYSKKRSRNSKRLETMSGSFRSQQGA